MVNNDFLPEDFNLEEWKLFKKYNNRMEKQSRHIDAWFVDEPNLSEEELKKRMAYNKEHLIKDTLEQIAKGVLVTEENMYVGVPQNQPCETCEPAVAEVIQVSEQPEEPWLTKEEVEAILYKAIEEPLVEVKEEPPVEVKPEPVPAPPTPPEPITNAPSNGQADMLNDIANKLDRLIALAESLTEEIASQKAETRSGDKNGR